MGVCDRQRPLMLASAWPPAGADVVGAGDRRRAVWAWRA
jgi:hypothetical protein